MPAKRDTQLEAARLRHLSPHQTVENQSQAWGIRFHSCTWREGLAPSWKTELRDEDSSRDLPGDYHLLSINGSHETHFNIQRRLYDYQFSLCRTPIEFEQAHRHFLELDNSTAHQGLQQETFE